MPRRVWGRAALRGAGLASLNLFLMVAVGLLAGGALALDVIFVVLLGLVAAPMVLVEHQARTGGRRFALWAMGAGLLAGLGFVMAWIQMTYVTELVRLGSLGGALQQLTVEAQGLVSMGAETRAVLCAFAPPFALVVWLRLAGWGPAAQAGIGLAAAQVISLAALIGFQGFPQVRWLVGAAWCSPAVGTFLFLQPVVLPLALPLLDHVLDGWEARRVARQADGEDVRVVGLG